MFRECSHQSTEFSKKRQPVAGHPFIVTHHLGLCEFFSVDALRIAVFVRLEHGVFFDIINDENDGELSPREQRAMVKPSLGRP